MQLGFPTAHMLTFLSSPPVTITRPDLCPSAKHFTLAVCPTNSSAIETHGKLRVIILIVIYFPDKTNNKPYFSSGLVTDLF